MTPDNLLIVEAGAGSGKTTAIQNVLGDLVAPEGSRQRPSDWGSHIDKLADLMIQAVCAGPVDPRRIMAVTFTDAAAAQLRAKVSQALLERGLTDAAQDLSQAYIHTFHSFGLRLIKDFAFDDTQSPQPRLIARQEQDALLRRALDVSDDELSAMLGRIPQHGYTYDWNTKQTGEQRFVNDILKTVDLLRSLNFTGLQDLPPLLHAVEESLKCYYGEVASREDLENELRARIDTLLDHDDYRDGAVSLMTDEWPKSPRPRRDLHRDYRNMKAAREPGPISTDWKLWTDLQRLQGNTRPAPPKSIKQQYGNYVTLTKEVSKAAKRLSSHPGPLEDAVKLVHELLGTAARTIEKYSEAKRRAGVVDYTDMVANALTLLEKPEVLNSVRSQIDVIVVDEFQDTNPLQFALTWKLHDLGIPLMVVGDLKQAIMGFQGADPRLMEGMRSHGHREDMPANYRSQEDLMNVLNAFGTVLFEDGYKELEPKSQSGLRCRHALEFVKFQKKPAVKDGGRALAVGRRIKELLEDESEFFDCKPGKKRRIRGGDIAILCRTNSVRETYANVLRNDFGFAVQESSGWYDSRPVEIVRHALQYVHDKHDRHAALYLATIDQDTSSLEGALAKMAAGEALTGEDYPQLQGLEALRSLQYPIFALISAIIDSLGLFAWEDPDMSRDQWRANIVKLLDWASEFSNADPVALAQSGYHGSGIPTFLGWLKSKAESDDGDLQPEATSRDRDAIAVRTIHKAKGMEWPVVVAAHLEYTWKGNLPHLSSEYGDFNDLSQVMANGWIRYFPKYLGAKANEKAKDKLLDEGRIEHQRLLYVMLTRARNKLIIEWPENARKNSLWSLMAHRGCKLSHRKPGVPNQSAVEGKPSNGRFWIKGDSFQCLITDGGASSKEDSVAKTPSRSPNRSTFRLPKGMAPAKRGDVCKDLTPDIVHPSDGKGSSLQKAGWRPTVISKEDCVPGLKLDPAKRGGAESVAGFFSGPKLGSFLHRCFEVPGMPAQAFKHFAQEAGAALSDVDAEAIAKAVREFEGWMQRVLRPVSICREWPLLLELDSSSVVSGTIDVLVETRNGLIVLDHKSDYLGDHKEREGEHGGQLATYVDLLRASGHHVLKAGIHSIQHGTVTWYSLPPE